MKLAVVLLALSSSALGHGGGLDSSGGHNNRKSGEYHCHREPCFSLETRTQSESAAKIIPNAGNDSTFQLLNKQASDCNSFLSLGVPGKSDQILCRLGYAIGYDYSKKSAKWVAYVLTPETHDSANVPRQDNFRPDLELPADSRKTLRDFEEPIFDRGHLVSSASLDANVQMNSETFLLSNMVPQLPGLNRAGWRVLENRERKWSTQRGILVAYTGVIFQGDNLAYIGDNVPVPTHFYKVLFDPKREEAISFVIPHMRVLTSELSLYLVSIDHVEKLTGLDFLERLEDATEAAIERRRPTEMW
jgi:endonuclease G, mitochondrial